jgi:protein disulfide-isomerase A1
LLPVVSIIDKKNFTAFQSKDEAVFIAFPVTGSEEAMFSSMASLAARNRDRFTFGVASQELVKSQTAHAGCILAYVTENGEPQKLCKEWKLDVLESFVEKATAPLIGEMTRRNELKYLKVSCVLAISPNKKAYNKTGWQISSIRLCQNRSGT